MDNTEALDALFAEARTHESALAIALRAGDEMMAFAAATRLREALGHAVSQIDIAAAGSPTRRTALREMYLASTIGMHQLLQRNLATSDTPDPDRQRRWAAARSETKASRGGPDIFELDSRGKELPEALFFRLHVANSRLLTDLRRSTFVDTFIECSDFTLAKFDGAIWQRTCIRRSFFHYSSFKNAILDDVAFFDCDLRDTDFSFNSSRAAAATTAQFIHCDLRGSRWLGRDLSTSGSPIDFIDCQLHGMVYDASPRNVSRADISPNGDGSWVMGSC